VGGGEGYPDHTVRPATRPEACGFLFWEGGALRTLGIRAELPATTFYAGWERNIRDLWEMETTGE